MIGVHQAGENRSIATGFRSTITSRDFVVGGSLGRGREENVEADRLWGPVRPSYALFG